ncbi:MAG TPA: cell surface protein SprA [Gemmatimonadales bacterium]
MSHRSATAALLVLVVVPGVAAARDLVAPRVSLRTFPSAELTLPRLARRPSRPWRSDGGEIAADWETDVRAVVAAERDARRRAATAPHHRSSRLSPDRQEPLTEIGLEVNAHLEMRVDQLRNARCDEVVVADPASGCVVGFPTPAFDQQFRVRAGGVVSDRFHVNVDFDSQREFGVNNDIGAWYEGKSGEFLQRVEVGNVTFRAPESRYVDAALLPNNAFGVQAQAQIGALELGVVAAQQRGSTLRTRVFTVGEITTQPVHVEVRDLDYETARFFAVVDPARLPGYPALDLLALETVPIPPELQPVALRVYRLRAQGGSGQENFNLGGIEAVAVRDDGPQRVGPFPWELLVEGRDYYLDSSGLWFALVTRLGSQDFLAVSYVTALGDTVGTLPSINASGTDTLFLIHEPQRGTDVPTFRHELRNVYRVGGADVVRSSVDLVILVNESERPLDGQGTYLERLGLAVPSDPSALDVYNKIFPRERDPGAGAPLRDHFVVFPHLQPFGDAGRLLAGERNDSLYRTPTYLLATQGPPTRFTLSLNYEASGTGDRSAVTLGALQVREGSERLFVGERELVRGRDYEIDYSLGQVRFLDPPSLFSGPTTVRAQFQENQLFDPARKNVLGFTGTYQLGSTARIQALGLLQNDRTSFTRPFLGLEPKSGFVGALRAEWATQIDGVSQVMDALPFLRATAPSFVALSGELAMSQPNPNPLGIAYVEDFEGQATLTVNLREREFQLGSAPTEARGLSPAYLSLAGGFDPADAVPLVWQNAVSTRAGVLEFTPRQIDSTIVLAGAGIGVEPVLWLTLKPDTVGGAPHPQTGRPRWRLPHTAGPRWRSLTQTLGGGSGVGVDLSRVESIEFWVLEDGAGSARRNAAVVLLDFGTVMEDVAASVPERFGIVGTDTVFEGRRTQGLGRLDSERDSLTNVFNAVVDDRGIHGDVADSILDLSTGAYVNGLPLCDLQTLFGLEALPRGSLRAACTRRNGRLDTEDLNGDNRLDVAVGAAGESVFRYVFRVGDPQYYVRDGVTHFDDAGRAITWRLYRIPFRADTLQIGVPNVRQIQALRMTLAVPDQGLAEEEVALALARFRLVGAPWVRRAATPILGLSGREGEPHGEVSVLTVSTENRDLGYTSPPGVNDLADRREAGFQFGAQQVNEKALRLVARDLRVGERAEALVRFANEADKNFLTYRTLRVWARGRGPGWNAGDLEFYLKVGRDEANFYMYRVPIRTDTWEPEAVIDLARWLDLRAALEASWLRGDPPGGWGACGGDTTAYVACSGPYLVHVRDPGVRPPNLAQVAEVAVGILRINDQGVIDETELWVDDIRLTEVVDDRGMAGSIDLRVAASDFAEVNVAYRNRDDRFRAPGEQPSYVADVGTHVTALVRADRLLPESWNLSFPISIRHSASSSDPFYVPRTDITADRLDGLRTPKSRVTTYEASIRRTKAASSALLRALVDPLSVRGRYMRGDLTASLSTAVVREREVRISYENVPGPMTVPIVPGFLTRMVERFPAWIRESEFGRALRSARLRWNPSRIVFSSTLTKNERDRFAFRVPVVLAGDSGTLGLAGLTHMWRNEAAVGVRPFRSLGLAVSAASLRDLQRYDGSTVMGRLLREERGALIGTDVGFERASSFSTTFDMQPVVASWLRPRLRFSSRFQFARDPNRADPLPDAEDTMAFRLPETIGNARTRELGVTVDWGRMVRDLAAPGSVPARVFGAILPIDITRRSELRSTFDRTPTDADLSYRLGFGDLDQFLARGGVPATAAGQSLLLIANGGVQLPGGGSVRVLYRNQEQRSWARRGEVLGELRSRVEEWPSLGVDWTVPVPLAIRPVLNGVSAGTQYREVRSDVTHRRLPTVDPVATSNTSVLFTPTLALTWEGGVVTAVQYAFGDGRSVTAGNVTLTRRREWTGSTRFRFRAPTSLIRLRDELRANITFGTSRQDVCLVRAGSSECRLVSDSRRHQVDLRVDTGLSETVRGGLTFSYVLSDQRHTATRLSQVVLSIFADVNLFAGRFQ